MTETDGDEHGMTVRSRIILIVNVIAALLIVLYVAWPYGTLLRFRAALKAADEPAVAGLVDWPSVRAGFREDLNRVAEAKVSRLFETALGERPSIKKIRLSWARASLVDRLADALATPRGFILLFDDPRALECVLRAREGPTSGGKSEECRRLERAVSKTSRGDLPVEAERPYEFKGPNLRLLRKKIDYAFFTDPITFKFDVLHDGARVILVFRHRGFGWRLTRASLPLDELVRGS